MYEKLYDELRAGNRQANAELEKAFCRRLHSRLRRRFEGRLAPWQIEDVVFDAFQELLRRCQDISAWQAAEYYLFRIGLSLCLRRLKKQEDPSSRGDPSPGAVSSARVADYDPLRRVDLKDDLEQLLRLSTVVEGRVVMAAVALVLHEGRNPSLRAISARTGLSPRKVKEALCRLCHQFSQLD